MEAICYLTANKNIKEMERRWSCLPNSPYFKRYILTDKKDQLSYSNEIDNHTFSFTSYIKNETILRYTYISILDFYIHNPNFKNYWLLEDDVIFKGNFEAFFDYYKNNESDFLLPGFHFDPYSRGAWYNSPYNIIHGSYFTKVPIAGGFIAICRFSNRLLAEIKRLVEQGTYGHCESFPHTICKYKDFSMYAINNDGFHNFDYCDQDKRFTLDGIINIPENNLIHAVKF